MDIFFMFSFLLEISNTKSIIVNLFKMLKMLVKYFNHKKNNYTSDSHNNQGKIKIKQ